MSPLIYSKSEICQTNLENGDTQGTFGSVDFFLYDWTLNGYTETMSVIRESGYDKNLDGNGEYGQGYINGEKVDFDEFEIALGKMYALLDKSAWFPMIDAGEANDYLDEWKFDNNN